MDGNLKPVEVQDEDERHRARNRRYYHANREKIVKSRKAKETIDNLAKCRELELPEYLAPHIRFYSPTKFKPEPVGLRFDSPSELLEFLAQLTKGVADEASRDETARLIMKHRRREELKRNIESLK